MSRITSYNVCYTKLLRMRHNDAKEKIAFYKSKQKTKDARRDITNKAIMLHKMRNNFV